MTQIIEKLKDHWNDIKAHPWLIFTKIWGKLWIPVCWPFRFYATNVVFNYVLQNNKTEWLERLWQRNPERELGGWILHDVHHVGENGYVSCRIISKVEFWLVVLFLYGWLDSDSNECTMDWPHAERNYPWTLKYQTRPKFGNAFDLGDKRAADPYLNIPASYFWNFRNTGMNFQYLFANY